VRIHHLMYSFIFYSFRLIFRSSSLMVKHR
jgi:hypothetical protein